MNWTAEAQATLEAGAAAGKSYQDVADELRVTRNAVAGRAHRTNVAFHMPGGQPPRHALYVDPAMKAIVCESASKTSTREAARQWGVSRSAVHRWLAACQA